MRPVLIQGYLSGPIVGYRTENNVIRIMKNQEASQVTRIGLQKNSYLVIRSKIISDSSFVCHQASLNVSKCHRCESQLVTSHDISQSRDLLATVNQPIG